MPRYSKYTPERGARILQALKVGNTRKASSSAGGVDEKTFRRWLVDFPEFKADVEDAELEFERMHVGNIAKHASLGQWTASAFLLERRNPQEWGRVSRVELLVRQQQATALVEELRAEGYEVTAEEVMHEVEQLSRRKALPPGSRRAG